MNLYMRYLLCQYSYLRLLGLIMIMLMAIKYSVKMPWLCMLCKMCDVRVCIGLVVFVAVAFIAIIIAILILMHYEDHCGYCQKV